MEANAPGDANIASTAPTPRLADEPPCSSSFANTRLTKCATRAQNGPCGLVNAMVHLLIRSPPSQQLPAPPPRHPLPAPDVQTRLRATASPGIASNLRWFHTRAVCPSAK